METIFRHVLHNMGWWLTGVILTPIIIIWVSEKVMAWKIRRAGGTAHDVTRILAKQSNEILEMRAKMKRVGSQSRRSVNGDARAVSLDDGIAVNPATGLICIDGMGGVDTAGSPYGVDLHHNT